MKQCIVSHEDKEIIVKLEEMGFICHKVTASDRVSRPICTHSDVLYQKINNNEIIISGCQKENIDVLKKCGYKVIICEELSPGYKTESLLNFIVNNNTIIYNPNTALDIKGNFKRICVRQGYTKCSVIPITESAYITDDDNIYNSLIKEGIDCLKIKKGDIKLDGYNYGFIGGASVKISNNEILFFGDISDKTDKKAIIEFLKKYDSTPIFIENKKLNDIGSALIL